MSLRSGSYTNDMVGRLSKPLALIACMLIAACATSPGAATSGGQASNLSTDSGSPEAASSPSPTAAARPICTPTPPDALGPFYKPGAPVRSKVDTGFILTGAVLRAGTCRAEEDAILEFWLANPSGRYDDEHRATVPVGPSGKFRFESNVPVPYSGRPPHIHIRVTSPGQEAFVTQFYPKAGQTSATFDLVIAA